MKPLKDKILVKAIGEDNKQAGSMIHAVVVAVGSFVDGIKVKDNVVFAPYGVDEIDIDGEKMIFVSDELILATYEPKNNKKATKKV